MNCKSLKNCTDEEIADFFMRALKEIREAPYQYGIIKAEVSGGKVKFITIEKPI